VVDPGHLRVLSQQEVNTRFDPDSYGSADVLELETREERQRLAALRLRLIRSAIVPERRLKIPSEAFDVCGEYLDRTCVWLEQSPTVLEIYTATYVQKLLAIPLSQFLPTTFQDDE
jgi:hypothetical protein